MKHAIALIIALAASPAAADPCKQFEEMAAQVMRNRLLGVPLSDMIEASRAGGSGPVSDIARAIVLGAYGRPAYQSEDMQRRAVREYATSIYLACAGGLEG